MQKVNILCRSFLFGSPVNKLEFGLHSRVPGIVMSQFASLITFTNHSLRFLRFVRVPLSNCSCLKLKTVCAEGNVVRKQRPLSRSSYFYTFRVFISFFFFRLTLSEKIGNHSGTDDG